MNKAQAKRFVCRAIAESIVADIGNGSEFLYHHEGSDEEMSDADAGRVRAAAEELAAELLLRGTEPVKARGR